MVYSCTVSDGQLCDKVIELNFQGYTVTKSKLLADRVHKIYYTVYEKKENLFYAKTSFKT